LRTEKNVYQREGAPEVWGGIFRPSANIDDEKKGETKISSKNRFQWVVFRKKKAME
jgi:hypothetical protein